MRIHISSMKNHKKQALRDSWSQASKNLKERAKSRATFKHEKDLYRSLYFSSQPTLLDIDGAMENVEFWPIWDRHFSWFFPFYAAYPADLVASAGASHWWSLIFPTRRLLGPSDTICHSTHRVYNEQCLSSLRRHCSAETVPNDFRSCFDPVSNFEPLGRCRHAAH